MHVDVDQAVRNEAARRLADQGLTIDQALRIVLEQAAAGCTLDFGALVPNATTVEAIEAARRGDVVELGAAQRRSPNSTAKTNGCGEGSVLVRTVNAACSSGATSRETSEAYSD